MPLYPEIDRDHARALLREMTLAPVLAAPEGRFILPVPALDDGKGPILTPNIKEISVLMRGSSGHVRALKLEASPQKIPADGTNVIVINRVDEFVQLALLKKLESLLSKTKGSITREIIENFMNYARGYRYIPENQEIIFEPNAGFHNDAYNMPVEEFRKRYVAHDAPDKPLTGGIIPGYYVKKPLRSHAAFLRGAFCVRVGPHAGGTMQEFDEGAMVNVPEDAALPLSFVHPFDIDICYRAADGSSLLDASGRPALPVYDIPAFLQDARERAAAP